VYLLQKTVVPIDVLPLLSFPQVMSEKPNMSSSTKELLKKVRMIVPPMLEKFHKGTHFFRCSKANKKAYKHATGQLGRVAVIGGSEKYVGVSQTSSAFWLT